MIDETLAQFRAHRQNIKRYRSLLRTSLTEFERRQLELRIAEEEAASISQLRRHQPKRPPAATTKPVTPAPAAGPATGSAKTTGHVGQSDQRHKNPE
jgi:hypothetical protein